MAQHEDDGLGFDDASVDVDVDVDVEAWIRRQRWSRLVRSAIALSILSGVTGVVAAVVFKGRYDAISSRAGDLKSLEARIETLKAEQAARGVDLERLRQSIAESQHELVQAQQQAQRAQCEADDARIDTEIILERVQCYKAVADSAMCDAENQKHKANGTLLGALVGVGLAMATGGGSLLAVGGAAVGSAGSGNKECPAVQCDLDPAVIESHVLAQHGLAHRRSCTEASRT